MFLTPTLLRRTAQVVLAAFLSLTLQPLQAAMQAPQTRATQETGEARYARLLAEMEGLAVELAPQAFHSLAIKTDGKQVRALGPNLKITIEDKLAPMPGVNVADRIRRMQAKWAELKVLENEADTGFAAVEAHLKAKQLPAEILARHEAALAEYHARRDEFTQLMQAIEAAQAHEPALLPTAVHRLAEFFARHPNRKPHTPTDPGQLPFRAPLGKTRPPIESDAGFKRGLFQPQPIRLAAAGSLSGIGLPDVTPSPIPTAADLAETEDVQLTPAIRTQAAELGNHPVKIHNWVRNHIEFLPTYGSLQGADLTLQSRRGNAFDTASLEIALLRAAGIPARYVYGTIEVPAAQAMNWVGGVDKPEAAQDLLGQGGIPNVAVISGGVIKAFRLEHVWVEAWVDYYPSRGAVNRQGDSWVPMDASFKQYAYTSGMDLKSAVPLDVPALLAATQAGATVNEAEGWVQNLNQAALQTALADYQARIKAYLDGTKPEATVGDVLGTKRIKVFAPSILPGSLPYKSLATGAKLAALPAHLQWRFRTILGDGYGSTLAALDQSTVALAGRKLTLSFVPAGPDDLALINSPDISQKWANLA